MKQLTICGVQSYLTRTLITKHLGAIAIFEDQYQELCLKAGIITDELRAFIEMAINKSKKEVAV